MKLFTFLIAAPTIWAQATGSITGIVTDANTHAPVAKATVSASREVEITDTAGAFTLRNLPAGATKVRVSLDGYRDAELSVPLSVGDLLKRDFELHPLARITGRIRIQNSDEPPKATGVTLRRKIFRPGSKPLPGASSGSDNTFEIAGLEPDDYTLETTSFETAAVDWEPKGPPKPGRIYTAPSMLVSLADGEQRTVDVIVTPVETWSATFAIELPRDYPEETYFTVQDRLGESGEAETSRKRKAGMVRIEGLRPGLHTITVMAGVEADRAYAEFTVNISDHDVDGLTAKLQRGVHVTGTIRILEDGVTIPPAPKGVPVARLLSDSSLTPEPMRGDPNRFQAEGVGQGTYRLELPLPDGFAITDILLGNVSTELRPFTLNGPAELTVLVTSKTAMITGTVRDKSQAPVKGARIALIPLRSDDPALIKGAQSGEGGAFVFRNLAPGKYRIEGADPVELKSGDRATIDVVR